MTDDVTLGGPCDRPAEAGRKIPAVVGLAGGIASGKSLVARHFASLGCTVIDADQLVHELLKRPNVMQQIRDIWGGEVFADGCVDRHRLGEKVFAQPQDLERLNEIIHPLVLAEARNRLRELSKRSNLPAIIVDAPLLFESGLDRLCDVVVFVDAPLEERCQRACAQRGWTPRQLERREEFQNSLKVKREKADYVLTNLLTPDDALRQVREVFSRLTLPENTNSPSSSECQSHQNESQTGAECQKSKTDSST